MFAAPLHPLSRPAPGETAALRRRTEARYKCQSGIVLSVSVKAVARNIRSYSAAQMTALPDDLRQRVLDELILAES